MNPRQLRLLNSGKARSILKILREQHHVPITANEISSKTRINLKTVYALIDKLIESGFVKSITESSVRGRPSSSSGSSRSQKFFLEEGWDFSTPNKDSVVSSGYLPVEEGFRTLWSQIVDPNEVTDITLSIQRFMQSLVRRVIDSNNPSVKKWSPLIRDIDNNFLYCPGCGINHEAREFIRALLMCMLEQLEKSGEFNQFLRENLFINKDTDSSGDNFDVKSLSNRNIRRVKDIDKTDKYFLLKKVTRLNPKKPVFYIGSKNPNRSKLTSGSKIIFFKLKNRSILVLASGRIGKIEHAQPEHRRPQAETDETRIAHINECNILRNPLRLDADLQKSLGYTSEINLKDSIIPIPHKTFNLILSNKINLSK